MMFVGFYGQVKAGMLNRDNAVPFQVVVVRLTLQARPEKVLEIFLVDDRNRDSVDSWLRVLAPVRKEWVLVM